MPTNKNAMTRFKILDELLSCRYHNYSLDDLTDEVNNRLSELYPDTDGVGRRTIEKDIYYLEYEGPFMVEIERYSIDAFNPERQKTYVKKCLRYANPSFSIFKKEMSDDEECLLREALSLLGQFDGLPNFDRLESLRLGLGIGRPYKQIISFTKNPLKNSNLLGELFTAISQKQVVKIYYRTFGKNTTSNAVNVYPYLLKEYNRRWYLFAASESDGKLLNFALDRIEKCSFLTSHKYIDYKGDINECFEYIIGVTILDDSPVYEILFWVSEDSKDYVLTKPLHESQRSVLKTVEDQLHAKYPSLVDGKFFRIDCKENYELIRELSSFGKSLIVIEPEIIKTKIEDRIYAMYEKYLNLRT